MRRGHRGPRRHGGPWWHHHSIESRVPRALRRGLQRRIFMGFGVTIIVTALVMMGVMQLVGGSSGWRRDVERARRFASNQLAAVWNDPPRRRTLMRGIADDLEVAIQLYGTDGTLIDSAGGVCQRKAITVRVIEPGTRAHLGRAEVCPTGNMLPQTERFLVAFGAALITIWAASGAIAHKLSHPLIQIADVAREIGRGRLQSRDRLSGPHKDDEAGVLADVLHDAAARIDKQLADQRALLAAVSHEIRTPLARMRLLIELAETNPAKLAEIDREIVELDVLVADLLAGARVDFAALKPVAIDGKKLATDALERAKIDPSLLDAPEDNESVAFEGDPTLLTRALTNVLQNALKYAGGIERLAVTRTADRIAFVVYDRGPGLLEGEETQIFEPFYKRAQPTDQAPQLSVGLGLALVRRIAESHGGRAFAKRRDGGGAEIGFEVRA